MSNATYELTPRTGNVIRVYSGGAPRAALKAFAKEFCQATGHGLAFTFDGVAALRQRLGSGERADVVLLPTPMIDEMAETGTIDPKSRISLARSAIGVVVREGALIPDVSTPEAVRTALLRAQSIAYSDPKLAPSGIHLTKVLARLGIAEAVQSKTTLRTPFDGGVALIANGDVELGMYLACEVLMTKGVELVGLLPPKLQSYVVYSGAVPTDSPSPEPALAFLRLLSDPAKSENWQTAANSMRATSRDFVDGCYRTSQLPNRDHPDHILGTPGIGGFLRSRDNGKCQESAARSNSGMVCFMCLLRRFEARPRAWATSRPAWRRSSRRARDASGFGSPLGRRAA
jgi:molybdate transport system substrate-binding protein